MAKIKRALVSVADKTGLKDLATGLHDLGFEIYATGGTAKTIRAASLPVRDIAEMTGFPEILGGRVKTLHPRIFGGLLAMRDQPDHVADIEKHGILLFDLVAVTLYAFAQTVAREEANLAEAIENIDIGGVALLRAAAKNHKFVTVLSRPEQYEAVLQEMRESAGEVSSQTRRQLATDAFATTASYDAIIHDYFAKTFDSKDQFPEQIILPFAKVQALRYGENPHQRAAVYRDLRRSPAGILSARQLHGKALSYNNFGDAEAALQIVSSFSVPAAAVVKHANPCGVAVAPQLAAAYRDALETDPLSAFGGIVGLNKPVDEETATEIAKIFTEVVVAPGFAPGALKILQGKKNLRLLQIPDIQSPAAHELQFAHLTSGILLQDKDLYPDDDTKFEIVSGRKPDEAEWSSLLFGWTVVRWVKSNAIVFTRGARTLGIGAGQMSRVDAALLAIEKAARAGLALKGSVVASDAFFPFADGIEAAAKAGATAVIQPGGSVRDDEVVAAADACGMAMVFTGRRHFRH